MDRPKTMVTAITMAFGRRAICELVTEPRPEIKRRCHLSPFPSQQEAPFSCKRKLIRFSSPPNRARDQAKCSRIRSTASSMRSSGAVRAMRKKPSPLGPYIEPGETTTAASSSTFSQKEVELWPSGTGAQT